MKYIWKPQDLFEKFNIIANRLNLTPQQAQMLLIQERFIARVATFKTGKNFVFKGGGLILRCYQQVETPRYTVDIDLLIQNMPFKNVENIIAEAIEVDLKDGVKFFNLKKSIMKRKTPYGGERFEISWSFFGKGQSDLLRVDICAGDYVEPLEISSKNLFLMPSDNENLTFLIYPPEFIFAEKLETIDRFKTGNTRFKDIIDLWVLTKSNLSSKKLKAAIASCFENRKSKYDKDKITSILTNKNYIEYLDNVKSKKYKDLNLPDIKIIVNSIIDILK